MLISLVLFSSFRLIIISRRMIRRRGYWMLIRIICFLVVFLVRMRKAIRILVRISRSRILVMMKATIWLTN